MDDNDILDEIDLKKKKKSFHSLINKSKYSDFEMDDVMLEA